MDAAVQDDVSQLLATLRRAEQESSLLRTIAHALSETDELTAALEVVLRGVCEATGWIVGQAWLVGPGLLVSRPGAATSRSAACCRVARSRETWASRPGWPSRCWPARTRS